ncbi:unnamed protein product, partial [Brachionus calyciflorus]
MIFLGYLLNTHTQIPDIFRSNNLNTGCTVNSTYENSNEENSLDGFNRLSNGNSERPC